ncbi:MAG TPA: hypothetical protein VH331_14330 [Allosphingosinicella sp.]|jgi:gp16 family phage-associated protein|nr:hypothetical protein [Allosphingosinicella sp.]
MSSVLSLEEAKARLSRIGRSAADLGRELDVPVSIVRGVLEGRLKGSRGDAHKVAVALGLKDGMIVADGTPIADAMKMAAAQ